MAQLYSTRSCSAPKGLLISKDCDTKTVILTRAQVKGNAFLKKMRKGAFQQNKQSEMDSIENNNKKQIITRKHFYYFLRIGTEKCYLDLKFWKEGKTLACAENSNGVVDGMFRKSSTSTEPLLLEMLSKWFTQKDKTLWLSGNGSLANGVWSGSPMLTRNLHPILGIEFQHLVRTGGLAFLGHKITEWLRLGTQPWDFCRSSGPTLVAQERPSTASCPELWQYGF